MVRMPGGRVLWRHRIVIVGTVLAACLVALVVASIYVLPDQLVAHDVGTAVLKLKPSELLTAKDNVRKTLLQGVGGLFFLATAFFAWRQLQVSRGQLQISRESQITEQFNKAIDHLGSEEIDVRLGGIYALERIANISERERGPVVEVLTAYIREHGPRPSIVDNEPDPLKAPKADVQAAMIVLARRIVGAEQHANLDLARVDLSGINLASPKVRGAELERVNLQESVLHTCNLEAAKLGHADMWAIDLRWSNLQKADLRGAYLREADLRMSELQGADLRGAKELELAKMRASKANSQTQWPDNFKPAEAGVQFVDAKVGTVDVTFTLPAEVQANTVALCGEFNQWSTENIRLQRSSDGSWHATVALEPGCSYRYRYLLDGKCWENSWQADWYVPNSYGSFDSVVVV